jgi:hypothetical protein
MAKLDIGVGEEFPLEEKGRDGDCRHGHHGHGHHHHHPHTHFWHDWFARRPERRPDGTDTQGKE